MSTIVTRAGKGSALTFTEADANFTNLNTDKAEKAVANTFTAQQSFTGTAATAPAIAGASDPNTGVFFPAADTVGIATAGSERMRIDSSGNISTVSSAATVGGKSFGWYNADTGAGSYSQMNLQTNAGSLVQQIGSTANGGLASFYSSASGGMTIYTSTASSLLLGTNSNTLHLVIDSTGNVTKNTATGGLGYGTGAGGTVTQATSRTTGVTLNKPTGQITMFTAAGSATWSNFQVTNSLVAARDTIVLSVATTGASNQYLTQAFNVGAGSFYIGFATTGGTASDTPVINFTIVKGSST